MKFKLLGVLAIGLLTSLHAFSEVQINGFASVVSGIDLEDEGQSDYGNRTVDNLQESRVALQWMADLDEGMRFVGQTMARGDSATGFQLNYDWAYFDFNVGDSAKLKFGRLRAPFYKYSDYLDVGYAYHWVTPPASMYSLSFSNIDGISYQQNMNAMGMDHSLTVAIGAYQGILLLGTEEVQSSLENFIAINWSATMGNHEFSAAYAQADVYVPADAASGLSNFAIDAKEVLINGDYGSFIGAGYKGTYGDFTVYSEYSVVKVDKSVFADTSGGYLGVSYNMDDYTYHITYGIRKAEEKAYSGAAADADIGQASLLAVDPGATPAELAAAATGTSLNSTSRFLGNGDSTTITLGVRKDIGAASAIKVDLDLYTEDRVQTAAIAGVTDEQKATTLKFAIETMF